MTERAPLLVAGGARQRRCGVSGAPWRPGSTRVGGAKDDVHSRGHEPCCAAGGLREVSEAGVVAHYGLCLDRNGCEFPKGEWSKATMAPCDFTECLALTRSRGEHCAIAEAIGEAPVVWPADGGLASTQEAAGLRPRAVGERGCVPRETR